VSHAVTEAPVEVVPTGEELLPGYVAIELLSRNRALDVYDAWSTARDCRVIVKVPRPDRRHEPATRRRLMREGRILLGMTHPHVVRAYELVGEPDLGLVLETLSGATLEAIIGDAAPRRLPAADIAELGRQLCSAIGYTHRQGVLHLDLKPSNIVSEAGRAKVIDFNLARRPGQGIQGSGTRQYMAPEQARGDVLGPPADVWGIGATLFEAATGGPPFERLEEEDRYEQLERRAEPVRTLRRLPPGLAEAIDSCLEPEPEARPGLDELARRLADHASPEAPR
jgi:eukaryotic-like serine/threonine-protein kinase